VVFVVVTAGFSDACFVFALGALFVALFAGVLAVALFVLLSDFFTGLLALVLLEVSADDFRLVVVVLLEPGFEDVVLAAVWVFCAVVVSSVVFLAGAFLVFGLEVVAGLSSFSLRLVEALRVLVFAAGLLAPLAVFSAFSPVLLAVVFSLAELLLVFLRVDLGFASALLRLRVVVRVVVALLGFSCLFVVVEGVEDVAVSSLLTGLIVSFFSALFTARVSARVLVVLVLAVAVAETLSPVFDELSLVVFFVLPGSLFFGLLLVLLLAIAGIVISMGV